MEVLPGGITLNLCPGAFPLSTDSMVLAHFARLPKNARVLDLGSGCGTLGLLLCATDSSCHVTGIELSEAGHQAALDNITRNGLNQRMESICADLRQVPQLVNAGSISCCISNPPYFSGGPESLRTPLARREDCCSLADLIASAAWALKFGGDFFLVHRPERMGQILSLAGAKGLEAKRICLVRHRPDAPVSLIALQLRKGAKPGLLWEELTLHNGDGTPTQAYKSIYHCKEN